MNFLLYYLIKINFISFLFLTIVGNIEGPYSTDSRVDVPQASVCDAGELKTLVVLCVNEAVAPGTGTFPAERRRDQVVGPVVLPATVARVR